MKVNMCGLRFRELQVEFIWLRQEWAAANYKSERQLLMSRIVDILDEYNCLVEQTVQERLARCDD